MKKPKELTIEEFKEKIAKAIGEQKASILFMEECPVDDWSKHFNSTGKKKGDDK